jgi:hypothetical protein
MSDPESRGTMLEIALDYEKLARRAEAKSGARGTERAVHTGRVDPADGAA